LTPGPKSERLPDPLPLVGSVTMTLDGVRGQSLRFKVGDQLIAERIASHARTDDGLHT